MFAQYQLSQLLALGGGLHAIASSVMLELVRDSDAAGGALWLGASSEPWLELAASEPAGAGDSADAGKPPTRFAGAGPAAEWARRNGWHGITLDERRDLGEGSLEARVVGFLALQPPPGADLATESVRFLALVRHELAIAFRSAQLRDTLASEQVLMAAILDGATDAIVAVDERRQVVRANPAAIALLGLAQARQRAPMCRELLGCGPVRRSDGATHEIRLRCGDRCPFEAVLEGPLRLVEVRHDVLDSTGAEVPVAGSYSYMPGPSPGAVAVLRDLRAERALEELRAAFLAAVSHELRTPLALIRGYVDSLLELELDPAAQRRSVEGIGNAATRLTRLVDELLDLTHIEGGGRALTRTAVRLEAIVTRLTRDLAESPGMRPIQVEIDPDLPPIHADAASLGHVLANLVDNAQKYGQQGTITIAARREAGMAVVSVRDHGPGIRAEDRGRVFERFYRGREVRGRIPGSGLGLYVCRRLVEAHGGQIWLESDGDGSSVSLSVPLMPASAAGGSAP